jgi:hypothetical protein
MPDLMPMALGLVREKAERHRNGWSSAGVKGRRMASIPRSPVNGYVVNYK